jgi:hypothetical protein
VFVLRSEDGSAWWRDGGGNFNVPIPRDASSDEGAAQATAFSRAARPASGNSYYMSARGSCLATELPSAQQRHCTLQVGGELARSIVDFEQQSQMTLMHRFNKAADLLDQVLQVRSSSPQWPGTQCQAPNSTAC